jgi:elongation factor Ts
MHVSWGRPQWVTRDQVDESALAKERELIARQALAEGKPENVIDRIVDGKIEAFYADNVLYDQKFVNGEKFEGTVGDMVGQLASKMGENISVRRVARVAIGE